MYIVLQKIWFKISSQISHFWSKPEISQDKRLFPAGKFPGSDFPFSRREMCNSTYDSLGLSTIQEDPLASPETPGIP